MSGGRPRDPEVDERVVDAALQLLAFERLPGFTADAIAQQARVGKASIYRRWRSLDGLLAVVVEDHLGTVHVDYGPGPGTTVGDVAAFLTASCSGRAAFAEVAVLPLVGLRDDLRAAYERGPGRRFRDAAVELADRAAERGETWMGLEPLRAAHALLLHRIALTTLSPTAREVMSVVVAILPSLRQTVENLTPERTTP